MIHMKLDSEDMVTDNPLNIITDISVETQETKQQVADIKEEALTELPNTNLQQISEAQSQCSLVYSIPAESSGSQSKTDSPYLPSPPNGGWGWMCVIGCAITHVLLGGFVRSFGIIYVELMSKFNGTAAATSLVGGLGTALRMFGGPLASILSTAFTVRSVVIVGGLLMALGSFISAFATSTEFMFFSYSIVCGVGGALVYTPGIALVGQYFTTRRGVALGLSAAGSGAGVFAFPPLLNLLFRNFGYFGAFLVMSAVVLHFIVCGALYRPLHLSYTKQQRQQLKAAQKQSNRCHTTRADDSEIKTIHLRVWSRCKQFLHKFWIYLNLKLLRIAPFSLFVVSYSFVTFAYIAMNNLLVAHAELSGIPKSEAALLLSIIGVTDVIGRVGSGFCYDMAVVRRIRGYFLGVMMLITSITILLWGVLSSFMSMAIVSAVNGLITGAIVTGRPVIVVDLVGVDNLSSSFGLTVFFQGIALMIGPLLAGYLKDVTGDYKASFYFATACGIFGALVMFAAFTLRHKQNRTELHV